MTWQSIRLELDRTRDFPNGSAGRAYLLRLPLCEDGAVDPAAILESPGRATMRRFWPNEPDISGHVGLVGGCWALLSDAPSSRCWVISELAREPFREGSLLRISEHGGEALPFRVARCAPCHHHRRRVGGSEGR